MVPNGYSPIDDSLGSWSTRERTGSSDVPSVTPPVDGLTGMSIRERLAQGSLRPSDELPGVEHVQVTPEGRAL
jgi:hypothetical protein